MRALVQQTACSQSRHVLIFPQDILANKDLQLDSMFIASLVHDIVRVSIMICPSLVVVGWLLNASKSLL